jgi:hypothetical protein
LPESIYNPKINLGPWFKKMVDDFTPHKTTSMKNGGPGPALSMLTFARLIEFVRDSGSTGDATEIEVAYEGIMREVGQARETLIRLFPDTSGTLFSEGGGRPILPATTGGERERVHMLCVAQLAMLLAMGMLVNSVLGAVTLDDRKLQGQVSGFPDELVRLGRVVDRYRPLGAGFIPVCLLVGCVSTTNEANLTQMTEAMKMYSSNQMQMNWEVWSTEMREAFQTLRYNMSLRRHTKDSLNMSGY